MFRIDDPSAAATLPAPEAAGTEGYWTEGNPASGVAATLERASWFNMVQEELRAIVTAAGLAPSKTIYNQVLSAIGVLIQQGASSYALDTGTANTYQVAYVPAVTSVIDGMVLRFRAKISNTGASTFSPNGILAAPIWGGDHAAIGGGEIIANGDVWVQWNSSLNGGNGAWLLLDSTGGYLKSPTAPQFDSSAKLATTAFVQLSTIFRFVVPLLTGYGAAPALSVNVGDTPVSQFGKAAAQSVFWSMPILSAVDLAKPIKLRIHYTGDAANNNYFVQLGYQVMTAGAVSPASYTNVTDTLAAPATAGNLKNYQTTTAVIPAGALAAQGWINCVLTRLSSNGSDTNTGNLQIINITMEQ